MNQTLDLTDALEQIKARVKIYGQDEVLAPMICYIFNSFCIK